MSSFKVLLGMFFKEAYGIHVNEKGLSIQLIVLSRWKYITQYISKTHTLDKRSFCCSGELYNCKVLHFISF